MYCASPICRPSEKIQSLQRRITNVNLLANYETNYRINEEKVITHEYLPDNLSNSDIGGGFRPGR